MTFIKLLLFDVWNKQISTWKLGGGGYNIRPSLLFFFKTNHLTILLYWFHPSNWTLTPDSGAINQTISVESFMETITMYLNLFTHVLDIFLTWASVFSIVGLAHEVPKVAEEWILKIWIPLILEMLNIKMVTIVVLKKRK